MSSKQLKQVFIREFIAFSKNSNIVAAAMLCFYIVQIFSLIAVGYYILDHPVTLQSLTIFAIIFLLGTRFRALNNIVHECTHYSFCTGRKYNIIMGKIAASCIFTSYIDYKVEHMSHHRSLGDYEVDLDFQSRQKFKFEEALSFKTILRHVMTPILGLHFPQYLSFSMTFKDGSVYGMIKVLLIAFLAIILYFAPLAALLFLIIPFVWMFSAVNYWTDCVDHAGLLHKEDDLYKSRNFIMNRFLRSIFFPRNDCYHLVHHLFPSVPAHHMERAHEMLLTNDEYSAAAKMAAHEAKQYAISDG
ncbi:MAG: hypothetical protein COB24_11490 [Hyphomicrobiales bacterium]|nr:MAG: hypothetical protein COB24_11490 [Hyphomicrobiales bacterium]